MNKTGKLDGILRALLALCAFALVAVVARAVYAPPQRVVVAGEQAPPFTVRTENGETISIPNFGGKLLILNFWASWCPPCVEETPSMSQFAKDYAGKGVVVLGVSVNTSDQAYRSFLQRYKPNFLTVRDQQIHRDYGTFMYPETYIIDSKGKVVQKIAEGVDWSSANVRAFVDSLL